jgi:hypothetical protein
VKASQLTRTVVIDNTEVTVAIGDPIWWFNQAQMDIPAPAFIVSFAEDNMVNLTYINHVGARLTNLSGVCLLGDSKLDNKNYRSKGCWCPRGMWTALGLKG